MIKKKFKIVNMDCSSCAVSIDLNLEEIDGIKSVKTSYAKQITEVEFDPKKVSEEIILETIEKSGYQAELDTSQ